MLMYEQNASDQRNLLISISSSLLLHLLLIASLIKPLNAVRTAKVEKSIEVEIVPSVPQVKSQTSQPSQQLVSPSMQTKPEPPPLQTNFRSDKDSSVEKQQIKRGDDPEAGPVVSQRAMAAVKAQSQIQAAEVRPASSAPKQIKTLKLDTETLINQFGELPANQKPTEQQQLARQPNEVQAFSRPAGSGAKFVGASGSSDYLPDLPDGDLTLLNAKADKFAVFVRRVAVQVFSALRESGWEKLSARDIEQLTNFNSFSAVMNADGKLISVRMQNTAGSSRFDEIVSAAISKGAHDPHPPEGAKASDGNVRFIFKARSWTAGAVAAKTGAAFERRWLVLATGLE